MRYGASDSGLLSAGWGMLLDVSDFWLGVLTLEAGMTAPCKTQCQHSYLPLCAGDCWQLGPEERRSLAVTMRSAIPQGRWSWVLLPTLLGSSPGTAS